MEIYEVPYKKCCQLNKLLTAFAAACSQKLLVVVISVCRVERTGPQQSFRFRPFTTLKIMRSELPQGRLWQGSSPHIDLASARDILVFETLLCRRWQIKKAILLPEQ